MKLFALAATVALLFASLPANARDGWQGRPLVCNPIIMQATQLAQCQRWVSTAQRPDYRGASCCGEADAYLADEFEIKDGQLYAILSEDYPAPPPYTDENGETYPSSPTFSKGQRILIPPEKINRAREDGGNPSGHGVVFMTASGVVLCWFGPTLT